MKKRTIIISALVAYIIIAGGLGYVYISRAPERQVSHFATSLLSYDMGSAYNLTTANFQKSTSAPTFANELSPLSTKGVTYAIQSQTVSGSYAIVTGKFSQKATPKTAVTFGMRLLKQNGHWKIDSLVFQ